MHIQKETSYGQYIMSRKSRTDDEYKKTKELLSYNDFICGLNIVSINCFYDDTEMNKFIFKNLHQNA